RRRVEHPRLQYRLLLDQLLPEERDRVDVGDRLRIDPRGNESASGIPEREQPPVRQRDRPEEPGGGVGGSLDLSVDQVVTEDFRHAGVVRAAVEISTVRGEHESIGDGGAEVESNGWCGLSPKQRLGVEHPDVLLAADLSERSRYARTI